MSRTVSSAEYRELGKAHFKNRDYKKAIEAFNDAIAATVLPNITLYDYRAASYEKLGDWNAAVRDGREAIRLNKKSVKGYLRTGNALQNMGKPETALGVYHYGMKNVPVNDKDFALLQNLHNKLTCELSPARAIDPFTILPVEIMEMILEYLPFRNIVNCLRVCPSWKQYLIRRPRLWTNLDLSGAIKPVSKVFIRRAVQYSENAITRLVVYRFQHTDILRNIATACKRLKDIEILSLPILLSDTLIEVAQCAHNLEKFVIRAAIGLGTATQILRHRSNLKHLECSSLMTTSVEAQWRGPFPSLQTVIFHGGDSDGIPASARSLRVADLLSLSPSLRVLDLSMFENMPREGTSMLRDTSLTKLTLWNVDIDYFPALPPTLTHLRFRCRRLLHIGPDHVSTMPTAILNDSVINVKRSHLPKLESLELANFEDISGTFIDNIFNYYEDLNGEMTSVEPLNSRPLSHLALADMLIEHSNAYSLFGTQGTATHHRIMSPLLKSLVLAGLAVTDDDIEALLTAATSMQSINLSSTMITGAAVKMLADGAPTLQYLNIDNCRSISSRDAVVYAEKKGIVVSCKMKDAFAGKGKKVRYG